MFTGIIEELGTVAEARLTSRGGRLRIASRKIWKELETGESVAVNGACLTVVDASAGTFTVDVSPESVARTNLGELRRGDPVNLERALTLSTRLGGHLVQGHVDGTGKVAEIRREGEGRTIFIAAPPEISEYLVEKGSIAVDGISLTVSELRKTSFGVAVIPHTLAMTNLGGRRVGDNVNLEVDLIAKYVRIYLERGFSYRAEEERDAAGDEGLWRKLAEGGFL